MTFASRCFLCLLFASWVGSAAADSILLSDATKSWWSPSVPDCDDVTEKFEYDSATESFVCRTDAGGGGGGDNISVGGVAAVDANFLDTAEVDFVLDGVPSPDTISANLVAGSIADSKLTSNYSGVGSCGTHTFVSVLNDNAAPTCAQPSSYAVWPVVGFTNCGSNTFMGAQGTDDNCSATEDNVERVHSGHDVSVVEMRCGQFISDGTCTVQFDFRENNGDTTLTCTTTNLDTCNTSGAAVTLSSGDQWAIEVVDVTGGCVGNIFVTCEILVTW